MPRARQFGDDRAIGSTGDGDDAQTAKVVLMELAGAKGPLSAADLVERTLLAEPAVESALSAIVDADLCTVFPADDRRPKRYATAINRDRVE